MTSRGRRDRIWAIGKESIPACFLIGRAGGGHEDDRDGLADLRRVLGDERHPADDRVDVLTQIRGVGPHTATLVNGGPWSFRRSQAQYR